MRLGQTEADAVLLWENPGLIILDDAGIWYTNQTGGTCCRHPTAKGHFIPFAPGGSEELLEKLSVATLNYVGVPRRVLEDCQRILHTSLYLPLAVDYGVESQEAWLRVVLPDGRKGVLTWENSD